MRPVGVAMGAAIEREASGMVMGQFGCRTVWSAVVGAGALITEGKSFPERSLIVGAPARAVRVLDDAAIKGIAAAADIYVRRFKQYAKQLKPMG